MGDLHREPSDAADSFCIQMNLQVVSVSDAASKGLFHMPADLQWFSANVPDMLDITLAFKSSWGLQKNTAWTKNLHMVICSKETFIFPLGAWRVKSSFFFL